MMNVHQYFLSKLAEECAEVGQRALKQMQFGKEESQAQGPSLNKTGDATLNNGQRLRAEINDLLAVIDCLIDIGEVPEINDWDLIQAKSKKKEKLLKYLNYSRGLGKVDGKLAVCGTFKTPEGWRCWREFGHEGPCAAVPTSDDVAKERA